VKTINSNRIWVIRTSLIAVLGSLRFTHHFYTMISNETSSSNFNVTEKKSHINSAKHSQYNWNIRSPICWPFDNCRKNEHVNYCHFRSLTGRSVVELQSNRSRILVHLWKDHRGWPCNAGGRGLPKSKRAALKHFSARSSGLYCTFVTFWWKQYRSFGLLYMLPNVGSRPTERLIVSHTRTVVRECCKVFSKVGRIAYEEVGLQLTMPILLYRFEASSLNKSQLSSLVFMVNRFLMKLFTSKDMQTIDFCRMQFNF